MTHPMTWPDAVVLLGLFVLLGFCVWCMAKSSEK